jgi:hypothetical protein
MNLHCRSLPQWVGPSLVFLVVCVLHLAVFGNELIADDVWFSNALDERTLGDFLRHRYQRWSGRLPIEAALVLLADRIWLWKPLNALMWMLLFYSSGRLATLGAGMSAAGSTTLAFALFMLVPPVVLFDATWWFTGSINYLWPMALGLYGLLGLADGQGATHRLRLSCLLASGLSMYNEQIALVLLPTSVLILGLRIVQRKLHGWDLAQVGFMLANAVFVFTAPGSYRRYLAEQATWFPDYASLGVLDKVALGFELVFKAAITPLNLLVGVMAVISAALVWRSPAGALSKGIIFAALAYLCGNYLLDIPGLPGNSIRNDFYMPAALGGSMASSARAYALSAWCAFVVACLATAATTAFWRSPREYSITLGILLLGLASLVAMGFSPTAYASGWRVQFVCQIAFLIVTLRLIVQFQIESQPRTVKVSLALIGVMAAYRVVKLLLPAITL